MKPSLFFLIIFLFFLPSSGSALERFDIITTAEMKQLLDDRKSGKIDFILVNGLGKMIFNHASIPGSINIPLNSYAQFATKLGENKDKLIIPY